MGYLHWVTWAIWSTIAMVLLNSVDLGISLVSPTGGIVGVSELAGVVYDAVQGIGGLAAYVIWCIWFYKAVARCREMGVAPLLKPRWAVFWTITPLSPILCYGTYRRLWETAHDLDAVPRQMGLFYLIWAVLSALILFSILSIAFFVGFSLGWFLQETGTFPQETGTFLQETGTFYTDLLPFGIRGSAFLAALTSLMFWLYTRRVGPALDRPDASVFA